MHKISLFLLASTLALFAFSNESKICKSCHPTIYNEYYDSAHRKASIYNNPIHKAYWEKHPKDEKGYTCAKCHTPSDEKAVKTGILTDNEIQREEPISCVFCHTIKSVDEGEMSNTNISTGEHKLFYTAQKEKKGAAQAQYKKESSWFGLVKKTKNSPYHKIDYNNENYYDGNVCMGCHSHTNNEHGFDIVMLDALISKNDKHTCISCHMPQIPGSKVTLQKSKTHAYHGIAGIHNMNKEMGKYIDFSVKKTASGFTVTIHNQANHALFGQAYREGVLKAEIYRDGKSIALPAYSFTRVLGKNGEKALPWDATETLKDTLIYEKKKLEYKTDIQKGDILVLTLGIKFLSRDGAKALGLEKDEAVNKFRILKTEKFTF